MNKEITAPIKKEIIWRELNRIDDLIAYLYKSVAKDGKCDWEDEDMRDLYYKINDMAMKLSEAGNMQWQLEEE